MAKLYFYYAAMNAGKSTLLLQASYNYEERGMKTLLFSPAIDTRKKGHILSRIGLEASSISFAAYENLFHIAQQAQTNTAALSCILVDEAQFLTKKQVLELTRVVDELAIPVLTYGLRSDFRGETFTGSLYLLIYADELCEIKTICHCGRKATMNMRIDSAQRQVTEGQQVEIGGNERYLAVCRNHFKLGDSGSHANR